QAPKVTASSAKLGTILAWFQKSGSAHSIKELEKALPSVGSINSMQVKDYLQALSDDNKIRVEKIGSGNWYWSFPSEEKKSKEALLEKAQEEYNKANVAVAELEAKVDEAGAAREEDDELLAGTGGDRKALVTKHANLSKELEALRMELAAYSEQDPVEIERKRDETKQFRDDSEKWTDQIMSMESWLRGHIGGDKEQMSSIMRMCYGDDLDEEEGGLRELYLVTNTCQRSDSPPRISMPYCKSPRTSSIAALRRIERNRPSAIHMASTSETPPNAAQDNPPGPASPRRGANRGRGGLRRGPDHGGQEHNSRGRGRGGRSRGWGFRAEGAPARTPVTEAAPALESSTEPVRPKPGAAVGKVAAAEDPEEGEVCFICASPVQHTAVAPCNHRTCHICSLRLRALYKTKTCAHCRTESDHIIFTDDATKNFEDFSQDDFFKSDDNLGIHFENPEIHEDTLLLLRYNCPEETCDVACLGWPDLHRHVKTAHGKVMCDLCTRNKKVFTHEHELFTYAELRKHQKFGDDNPGAIDQSGFKGHPECGFCRQRFYGDDELFVHCRDKHERCHICDRRDGSRKQQYYVDYNSLEQHFHKEHFPCLDRECLEKKFVVFDSEMDLKAHQLEVHPNGLSKDARRDARRVDMAGFDYRPAHDDSRRGGREGRSRGRGRDPNSEPLPASSAQPMSRAELAYQRQMAVQSGQPGVGRSFGGQLTSSDNAAVRPTPREAEPSTITATRPVTTAPSADNVTNNLGSLTLESQPTSTAPRTPQEQARLLRHQAVIERATNMLQKDASKLDEFKAKISAYRTSKLSATELIEGFFALFDTSATELGKLVKELADIFEMASKRDSLLKAWSDWRAINEDYPSLPGAATGLSLSGGPAAHGGSRVLKLKNSTAQSSRSAVSRQASWATTSSNSPFPPLSAASSGRIGAKPGQTPWATPSANASARVSPMPSRAASSVALNTRKNKSLADAFPALPAAPKPTSTIFSPGYTGAGLIRNNSGHNTPVNAWTGAGAGSSSSGLLGVPGEDAAAAGGKKKGNKNKKQTLFHFG
ncbi:Mnd1 family-domain-containing protein, partial [Lophiotrema nucula]